MKMYSIFDRAAHMFGSVIVQNNDDLCKRNVKTALISGAFDKQILTYPEDFELYCLGDFDNETGKVVPIEPAFVIGLRDLIPAKEEKENG